MSKTMTITVSEDLGMALVASGAAIAVSTTVERKQSNPHLDLILDLAKSKTYRSGRDFAEGLKQLDALGPSKKVDRMLIVDRTWKAHDLSTTTYTFEHADIKTIVVHKDEQPSALTIYTHVMSRDGKTAYLFSEKAFDAVTTTTLSAALQEALQAKSGAKRDVRLVFEDNGCEIETYDSAGRIVRLVRYETTVGSLYATGPLSTMPLVGMQTEVAVQELGELREAGGVRRAMYCEPGDTGRLVKWEPNGSGWQG